MILRDAKPRCTLIFNVFDPTARVSARGLMLEKRHPHRFCFGEIRGESFFP
jgi:hypothetical protein